MSSPVSSTFIDVNNLSKSAALASKADAEAKAAASNATQASQKAKNTQTASNAANNAFKELKEKAEKSIREVEQQLKKMKQDAKPYTHPHCLNHCTRGQRNASVIATVVVIALVVLAVRFKDHLTISHCND